MGGNQSRWINHSCEPNCETFEEDDRIFVHALRGLKAGEELFYDYKMVPSDRADEESGKGVWLCLPDGELPRDDAGAGKAPEFQ